MGDRVGAVVVLMLWLYLMGAVILIGGEINAEIAHAADRPWLKNRAPIARALDEDCSTENNKPKAAHKACGDSCRNGARQAPPPVVPSPPSRPPDHPSLSRPTAVHER